MKKALQRSLLLTLLCLSHGVAQGELTVSGRVSEIKDFVHPEPPRTRPLTITLVGSDTYRLQPREYQIEGIVFTRGKEYREVTEQNESIFTTIRDTISNLKGASLTLSNTFGITSEDLAFSELRELEFKDGFRIIVQSIGDVDFIIRRLSEIKGIIIKNVHSITKESPEKFEEALQNAKADLKRKVQFYEDSFGVNLKLLSFRPFKSKVTQRETSYEKEEGEAEELEEYIVETKRKRPERTIKSVVEKGFFEKTVKVEISASYEIRKPGSTSPPESGE